MSKKEVSKTESFQLSKDSTSEMLKTYFKNVLKLKQSGKPFPVDLDDVWPMVYPRKDHAVRVLRGDFVEGEDFIIQKVDSQSFPKNGEVSEWNGGGDLKGEDFIIQEPDSQSFHQKVEANKVGGDFSTEKYYLSVPCLEYFIAKRVKVVFEVYRQVFHKVAEEGINPLKETPKPIEIQNPFNNKYRCIRDMMFDFQQSSVDMLFKIETKCVQERLRGSISWFLSNLDVTLNEIEAKAREIRNTETKRSIINKIRGGVL
ncbi:MAG: hypothetical protein LBD80_08605 [Tannerella sp.]|jgi:hypothetical protein|nr:hypothetical protein [Tannerella sp.]